MKRRVQILLLLLKAALVSVGPASAWAAVSDTGFIPLEAHGAVEKGNRAFSKKDFEAAIQAYGEALQLAPGNLVALVNLGVAQYRKGDFSTAEVTLKQAVRKRMEASIAWMTLGTIYVEQKRFDEAFAALAQARCYDPKNPRVHNELGVIMSGKGWSDAAESELLSALEICPTYSDAHYNLAVVYFQRNPPALELAKRHYYTALEYGAAPDPLLEKALKPSPVSQRH